MDCLDLILIVFAARGVYSFLSAYVVGV